MTVYEALDLVVQSNIMLLTALTFIVMIIIHLNKKK